MNASCTTCRFFLPPGLHNVSKEPDIGLCRRYAPRPGAADALGWNWPTIAEDEWCGEHEERRTGDPVPSPAGRALRIPSPDDIEAARSPRGGWTRATLARWGVPWPPPHGWRKRLEAEWRQNEGAPR